MKEYEFDLTKLILYDEKIAVVEAKEGVSIDIETTEIVLNIIESTYDGDYAFLINAKNSYSVEAQVYEKFIENQRIKCIGAISYHNFTDKVFYGFEKNLFPDKPTRLFHQYEEALQWAKHMLNS